MTESQHHVPIWMWFALGFSLLLLGPLALVVWVVIGISIFRRNPEIPVRRLFLKRAALLIGAVPAGFFALFVTGEMLTDPGGWVGLGLVASWAVPAALLATAAWKAPHRSASVFVALTAAVIAMLVWSAVDRTAWRSFEDDHGPVGAIILFTVTGTSLFLAWRRPGLGGVLLIAVPTTSIILAVLGGDSSRVTLVVAALGLLPGLLFLASEHYGSGAESPWNPSPSPPPSSS